MNNKPLVEIIKENNNLIYSIINKYAKYYEIEDLYQVSIIGIMKAYQNYKQGFGVKFTTYAYPYILGEMRKLVREDKGLKVSREITKLNLKIEKAYVLLSQKLMKEPTTQEIANFLEIPEYYVSEAILSLNKIKSIDEPVNNEGKELTLQDVIGKSENVDDLIMLKELLQNLNNEEKTIIENRYMKDYTQSETSKIVGMSQVQVSRKEQKVLQKLKQKMNV